MRVEAMKKRSRAGGKPVKALPRKALKLKPRKASTTVTRRRSASAGPTKVAQLTRERNEALEQLKATSNVLQVISSFAGKLDPVFDAILANATRISRPNTETYTFLPTARFRLLPRTELLPRLHWSACARVRLNPHPVPPSIVCSGQKRPYKSPTCWLIKTIRMSTLAPPCFSVKVFEHCYVSQ
jgi:hypothetical protein